MLDLAQASRMTRFTIQASMVGLPAIALPVGMVKCRSTSTQLPAALQLIGRPWHEASLLRIGAALEARLRGPVPLPRVVMPDPLQPRGAAQ